jgi:hypothetical protein
MNASARREDLCACLDCALPIAAKRSTSRTSPATAIGWMLLTGLACSGSVNTHAAEWLSTGTAQSAATAVAPKPLVPPTPPLPPSPLASDGPAVPATVAAKPATQSQVKDQLKDQPKDQAKQQKKADAITAAKASVQASTKATSKAVASTWTSLTSWLPSPMSTAKTPPQAKDAFGSPAPTTAVVANSAPLTPTQPSRSSRPASTTGRFDPDFGPAGHFVTDAKDQALQPPLQMVPPRTAPQTQPEPDMESAQSAVATDEPVSLVSWLSSYYGGTQGYGSSADQCPDVCLTDTCCPTWEAQVDALFLWQGNLPGRQLYVETANGATALDANQLYAPAAIAPRYALTYHRDDCRAIEVNYFQLWGFNAQEMIGPQIDGAGEGIYTANNLVGPDYDRVASARATTSANIQSLEVNLRRTDGGMIEWISGFRWLEWGQNLNITDNTVEEGVSSGDDLVDINTLNNLYGWQWGGDMMLWNAGRWLRINGIAKAGVYYNHQAAQNTYYTDYFNPDVSAVSADDTVSFVGETGINASFALTNWLSWRTGYTCFWLGGVATPVRQLGLTNIDTGATSINTNGSVFLHGVNTGLEARW